MPQRVTPELEYLQTKWAGHLTYREATELLREVLPLDKAISLGSIRRRVLAVGNALDAEIVRATFADRTPRLYAYVHKQVPSAAARLDQFLLASGVEPNERVTVISDDAGEFGKAVEGSQHARGRILDWFHIAMKFKAAENPVFGSATIEPLERDAVKAKIAHASGTPGTARAESRWPALRHSMPRELGPGLLRCFDSPHQSHYIEIVGALEVEPQQRKLPHPPRSKAVNPQELPIAGERMPGSSSSWFKRSAVALTSFTATVAPASLRS